MRANTTTKRRACELLSAFVLLLIAVGAFYGVRGYFVHDSVGGWLGGRGAYLASFRGGLEFSTGVDTQGLHGPGLEFGHSTTPLDFVARQWEPKRWQVEAWRVRLAGFSFAIGSPVRTYAHNGVWVPVRVVLPAWFVVLVLLLIARGLHRRRRKLIWLERTAAALCGACGYDLRASPGRCPECGEGTDVARAWRIIRQYLWERVIARPSW